MTDSDISAFLNNAEGWKGISAATAIGHVPQSVSAVVPAAVQKSFCLSYAKLILGKDGWDADQHPDLINAGKHMTAPGIAECRTLQVELALHPVVSNKRLAVIWAADQLSLDAENSLLKLTEEPPDNGCILFISEKDTLIPTIKSRVWSINIELPEEFLAPSQYPSTVEEWAQWLEQSKKSGAETVFLEMEGWVRKMADDGDYEAASNLETLIKLMELKNMSLSMVQDLVFAVVKGGITCEQVFSNLR